MGFVEFADGELIVHSPLSIRHREIAGFLTFLLTACVDSNGQGRVLNDPAVVRLQSGFLYEPGVLLMSRDRLQTMEPQYYCGAPSLLVKVLSPSTRNYDLRVKAAKYREHGVQEHWSIDTAVSRLHQHVLSFPDAGYTLDQHFSGRGGQ